MSTSSGARTSLVLLSYTTDVFLRSAASEWLVLTPIGRAHRMS